MLSTDARKAGTHEFERKHPLNTTEPLGSDNMVSPEVATDRLQHRKAAGKMVRVKMRELRHIQGNGTDV